MRGALVLTLFLFPLLLHAQGGCGVKVKASDKADYAKALAEYEAHRYREASQLLRRVAQRNPKAADPQFWLGMASVKNGFNAAGVRKYFTQCIVLCPQYPNALAHFYMGMVHYTDERYEEAVAELDTYFRIANESDDRAQTAVYDEASAYLHWARFLGEARMNMVPFDPRRVEGVSSKRNETLPFITHDGSRCYYLRQVPVKKDRTSFYTKTDEAAAWRLYVSDRQEDGSFSKGTELPKPFNTGVTEGGMSLTADGCTLYYSRITTEGGYANSDIYYSIFRDGRWGEVQSAGTNVNGDRTWESQPSISADGSVLYFASNRKGGYGGSDIWRCRRLKNGDWSRAENLGSAVNTAGDEKFPFIHADGHTLYFVSDGWQGFGGYDVYFTDMDDAGSRQPTNLGLPINSEGDEMSFSVTADGTQAYFPGSAGTASGSDVMMFDLYPAARPEPMAFCRIAVTDTAGMPLEADARLDGGAHYHGRGEVAMMLSSRDDNIVTISTKGMLPAVLPLSATTVRRGGVRKSVALLPTTDGTEVPLEITFLSGSRLSPQSERVLDAWVAWLVDNPRIHVEIGCRKETDAKAVYDYFKKKKLRTDRLSYRGGSAIATNRLKLQ
ncbi:MAG: PD40 domain-containing protein [Bacteroidales bacterium]|nr:PD40 domain-containing protein [Bacteroidales bacterium]